MLMAAFGEAHGNLAALHAVLATIDGMGIQTIVNTGNSTAGHPQPDAVLDLLRTRGIRSLLGEEDRHVVLFQRKRTSLEKRCAPEEFEALRRAHEAIACGNLEFLQGLPRKCRIEVDEISVCVCHGTPNAPADRLREEDDFARFQRLRELANSDVVICGGSAPAFSRLVDGALFVHPGAVASSSGEDVPASFAVIDTEREPWRAHLHRIDPPA
ncbi:MAG: hypothetical protein GWP08_11565 [Nitrospiraceae bacterium]|nr:hypothetical protein [Nitrospiraceae bacterium]